MVPSAGAAGEVLHVLAELGVLLLLFEIGLETDLREMFRVGPASLAVAVVGVAVPFGLGYAYWAYLPHPASGEGNLTTAAIFVGATLTATSVGITARVLSDLGRMNTAEARIIIGAAVIDDVLGLVILSVVSGVASGAPITMLGILGTLAVAVGFLVVAVLAGRFLVPRLFDVVVRMRVRYVLLVFAIAFALGLSAVASLAGSALIIGAFAAGLILSGTNQFDTIEREVRPVGAIFAPIFFVSVGASVDLRLLDPTSPTARGTLAVAARAHRHRHRRQGRGRLGGTVAAHAPARRRRRHGAPRRGGAHLRRHRPPVGRAVGGGVRRGAADGHGDHLRRAAGTQGAVRPGRGRETAG